jgi:hypothetical protein
MRVQVADTLTHVAHGDRPFQPYSAALCNCLDDDFMLTPDALASGDNFSPLQQARSCFARSLARLCFCCWPGCGTGALLSFISSWRLLGLVLLCIAAHVPGTVLAWHKRRTVACLCSHVFDSCCGTLTHTLRLRLQVRRLREARQRDPSRDLPSSVLCAKWKCGDSWAVLEANLQSKEFRILYVDPFDGHQKIWNVSRTYEAYLEMYQQQQAAPGAGGVRA